MSDQLLVVLPVLIPMTAALVGMAAWNRVRVQRWATLLAGVLLLAAAVELLRRGGARAPPREVSTRAPAPAGPS